VVGNFHINAGLPEIFLSENVSPKICNLVLAIPHFEGI